MNIVPTRLPYTLLVGLLISVSVGIATAGPISPLYLTGIAVGHGNQNEIVVIQGTSVVNSWFTHSSACGDHPESYTCGDEKALAVGTTIRTLGAFGLQGGAEYTLGGSYTGVDFSNPLPGGSENLVDGTRDASHNYAVRDCLRIK